MRLSVNVPHSLHPIWVWFLQCRRGHIVNTNWKCKGIITSLGIMFLVPDSRKERTNVAFLPVALEDGEGWKEKRRPRNH